MTCEQINDDEMMTLLSRPNKVGLKFLSIRPSTKSFFDFNEIWHASRGR